MRGKATTLIIVALFFYGCTTTYPRLALEPIEVGGNEKRLIDGVSYNRYSDDSFNILVSCRTISTEESHTGLYFNVFIKNKTDDVIRVLPVESFLMDEKGNKYPVVDYRAFLAKHFKIDKGLGREVQDLQIQNYNTYEKAMMKPNDLSPQETMDGFMPVEYVAFSRCTFFVGLHGQYYPFLFSFQTFPQ